MSPILKRDLSEQLRQAKRLASAATGYDLDHDEGYSAYEPVRNDECDSGRGTKGYTSSSSARQGIGVDREEAESSLPDWRWSKVDLGANDTSHPVNGVNSTAKGTARVAMEYELPEDEDHDGVAMAWGDHASLGARRERLEYAEPVEQRGMSLSKWRDLRSLLFEATPSLMISLVGLVFTGELLEHLARWRVFRRVDELFILVPMIGNLKGNLEMCLSARLGTSANIGELDHRKTRRAMLFANMTLLGLQALLISCLAAVISFVLGLLTIHRLGDTPANGVGNGTVIPAGPEEPLDPGLAMAGEEWHEGYTRPGWKQLVMVLATGMGSAGLSSAVLGTFMSSLIVLSRWLGMDPDNITPPLAACLGDLLTLFILALLGTALVGTMDTVIPLLSVIVMSIAAGWFTRRVMRNEWVKNVAKGGWVPLIGAMLISSGTGMVLAKGVGKYRGFALLAISMTGLTGSMGAIHANRLSTSLHTLLHPRQDGLPPSAPSSGHAGLSPLHGSLTLFAIGFPCQAAFLWFVSWAGWIDLSLGWTGWACFALTAAMSIALAHWMTLYFWSKDLDPDSYTLPIHSALVDFLGQLILMVAYEICIWAGKDVLVKPQQVDR
ncbi:hypothetical protein IAU60_001692 [Kwoniella sp. DSM 27419]